jgi:hypothetical protein
VVFLLVLCPQALRAQTNPVAEVNRGVELVEAGKLTEAVDIWLAVFEQLETRHQHAVHLYLGLAYKELGQLPEAWHHLTEYLRSNDTSDPETGKDLQETEETLITKGYVKTGISCTPEQAMVGVDNAKNPFRYSCPLTWWFKPGRHKVTVAAEKFATKTEELAVLARGGQAVYSFTLEPLPGSGGQVLVPEATVVPTSRTFDLDLAWRWSLLGAGVVVAGTGGIINGIGYNREIKLYNKYLVAGDSQTYNRKYDDEVVPRSKAAYVLYGIGGAAAAAGAVFVILEYLERGKKDPATTWTVLPLPSGAVGEWRF